MKQYFTREFLLSNKKLILKAVAVISIIAAAFLVFVWDGSKSDDGPVLAETNQEALEKSVEASQQEQTEETKGRIIVDVGGAVERPQVVELEEDSRVGDAISAAGGLKDNADPAGINQAAFLADGEKVYIPVKGETSALVSGISGQDAAPAGSMTGGSSASSKVNLNTATAEELQTLNGVGPATAEKILDYRTANGGFKKIEDLKNVNGIGDKTFEKLKEHIMV